METEKFNIVKIYPELYRAKQKEVVLIEVPILRVLAITGQGNTKGPRFQNSVEALYAIAEGIRNLPDNSFVPDGFMDFTISPLETLWSMVDGNQFDINKKDHWQWELFLVVPGFVTQALVRKAIAAVSPKKPNPVYDQLHVTTLEEKQAVQTLHIGSYESEAKDIELMQKLMDKHGLKASARHHEIYLNSPNDVPISRLRTILRRPVVPAKNYD